MILSKVRCCRLKCLSFLEILLHSLERHPAFISPHHYTGTEGKLRAWLLPDSVSARRSPSVGGRSNIYFSFQETLHPWHWGCWDGHLVRCWWWLPAATQVLQHLPYCGFLELMTWNSLLKQILALQWVSRLCVPCTFVSGRSFGGTEGWDGCRESLGPMWSSSRLVVFYFIFNHSVPLLFHFSGWVRHTRSCGINPVLQPEGSVLNATWLYLISTCILFLESFVLQVRLHYTTHSPSHR